MLSLITGMTGLIGFIAIWVLCASIVAAIAELKNLHFGLFFLLSLVFSPPIGMIVALFCDTRGKRCPACAEMCKKEAGVCKHCSRSFYDSKPIQQGSAFPTESFDLTNPTDLPANNTERKAG